jgi:septal ring factor EnvC (AmiA/AmiB activator)
MAKDTTAAAKDSVAPPSAEVTKVFFTDAQMVSALQTQIAQLKLECENEARANQNLKYDIERRVKELRDLQAQLLASQDRVTELQGKLLTVRAAAM